MTARIPRETTDVTKVETVKSDVGSSEESAEDLDKIEENIKKVLNDKENEQFTEIMKEFRSAKTPESKVDGLVRNDLTVYLLIERILIFCFFSIPQIKLLEFAANHKEPYNQSASTVSPTLLTNNI